MTKREIYILFAMPGLEEMAAKQIVIELEKRDIVVKGFECRYKKVGVLQCLNDNPEINVAIISQHLEERFPYTGRDYENLMDDNEEVQFIPILPDNSKGEAVVTELFQVGIYSGLFDSDADFALISEIIKKGRSRKEAKMYYNLSEQNPVSGGLDYDSCVEFLTVCKDSELEKNISHVQKMTTPYEFQTIVNMLKDNRRRVVEKILLKSTDNDQIEGVKKEESKLSKLKKGIPLSNGKEMSNSGENKHSIVKKGLVIGFMILLLCFGSSFYFMSLGDKPSKSVPMNKSDMIATVVPTVEPIPTPIVTTTVTSSVTATPTAKPTKKPKKKPKKTKKPKIKTTKIPKRTSAPQVKATKRPAEERINPNQEEIIDILPD